MWYLSKRAGSLKRSSSSFLVRGMFSEGATPLGTAPCVASILNAGKTFIAHSEEMLVRKRRGGEGREEGEKCCKKRAESVIVEVTFVLMSFCICAKLERLRRGAIGPIVPWLVKRYILLNVVGSNYKSQC